MELLLCLINTQNYFVHFSGLEETTAVEQRIISASSIHSCYDKGMVFVSKQIQTGGHLHFAEMGAY